MKIDTNTIVMPPANNAAIQTGPWNPGGVAGGDCETTIGSASAYRDSEQYLVTTTANSEISIAYGSVLEKGANLTDQRQEAKSSARCGVCLIPGLSNIVPWRLVVVYRGFGNDQILKETLVEF